MHLRKDNSPRKMFLPPKTRTTNRTRLNPSECNPNIERHAMFIGSSSDVSQFTHYYGHSFSFIRCRTTLCTFFFPAICVTQVPSTPFQIRHFGPVASFIQYNNFYSLIFYDVLALLEKKSFSLCLSVCLSLSLSLSLYCLLCGRYKVRIFIIRLNSLKHSQ
jgi:hypothetical protein